MLPHPQVHQFGVAPGEVHRVVLASDGLWDVCTPELAAEIACQSPTCEEAAVRLLGIAEEEYLDNRGHEKMDDDTTVLVVEMSPSGARHGGAASRKHSAAGAIVGKNCQVC